MVGDRWLVDGALVNPVPVSAARALGAEIVIAANLSSDVFTHSTTIYSHGQSADAPETVIERSPPKCGLASCFRRERTMKRQSPSARRTTGHLRSWSMHSTSCRTASPARVSPAIRPTLLIVAARRPDRLVRLPPRRRSDRIRRARRRARPRCHPGHSSYYRALGAGAARAWASRLRSGGTSSPGAGHAVLM